MPGPASRRPSSVIARACVAIVTAAPALGAQAPDTSVLLSDTRRVAAVAAVAAAVANGRALDAWDRARVPALPTPAGAVVTPEVRARVDSVLRRLVTEGSVAGVSALVHERGREAYFGAFGLADREAGRPMRRDAIVQIFSMTKPLTGVALLTLVEEGKVALDDPVAKYLPALANVKVWDGIGENGMPRLVAPRRAMTVRDLTRHTAGFATGDDDPGVGPLLRAADPGNRTNTLAQLVEKLATVPLLSHPGERWAYGPSVDVQAALVERVAGQPFERYVRERILAPLGMRTTRYVVPDHERDRFAAMYRRSDDGVLTRLPDATALAFNTRAWPLAPGGWGYTSTLDDYARFARMLVGDGALDGVRILRPETVRLMRTDHLPDGVTDRSWLPGKGQVGFGVDVAVRVRPPAAVTENNGEVGEFFWDGAASTLFWVDPVNELTAVLFVQLVPYDRVGLHKRFRDAVYGPVHPATLVPSTTTPARPAPVPPPQGAIGAFDGHSDVGRVRVPGTVMYDSTRQEYHVSGSGRNMWSDRDDFHLVWKRLTGDFILQARVRFVGAGGHPHRKVGWTIRPSLETSAAHVTAALHGDGLVSLQTRRTPGAQTDDHASAARGTDVIRLERRGGRYTMSVARHGDTLAVTEVADVVLPDTVYAGVFVCAHDDSVSERAVFSNVRITIPPRPDFVAYRDYLGSNLEILDVETGHATIVHRYRGSFQAPNWTPDGRALIVAQEGKLLRFDIAASTVREIDTGFANRNNNDHVLSFDGRRMGISHHAAEDGGRSIVYVLPAEGGTPERVTSRGPSYLHGWSPDGRWLVYTGDRGGALDVYKVRDTGGEEIRLTSAPGLDDGAEYAPDGKWIWFNSSRTGRMQLWRMRPDGREQTQVTNDGFNNWFPHVSPDGRWVAYLSYGPEVRADDHPFYERVQLRVMPAAGGPSRVIAYVYGGQGTINVPSWSPDSRRLSFVSNTWMP